MSDPIDISRLRELARAVIAGAWPADMVAPKPGCIRLSPALAWGTGPGPTTVLALLDRIASLEAERDRLLARVAELEAARHLCEECADDDAEHGLELVGDWHCGSCGAVLS